MIFIGFKFASSIFLVLYAFRTYLDLSKHFLELDADLKNDRDFFEVFNF